MVETVRNICGGLFETMFVFDETRLASDLFQKCFPCVCCEKLFIDFLVLFCDVFTQVEMKDENPECVLDSLIQYQRQEIQVHGEPKHFTDELIGALLLDIYLAGKQNSKVRTHVQR